jgi:hypothetical protein
MTIITELRPLTVAIDEQNNTILLSQEDSGEEAYTHKITLSPSQIPILIESLNEALEKLGRTTSVS